ncbi:Crp/Fnr family transcriptional regulator [Empedobacter stercoris]|mgnify:FL=1|uniref:Crp/Fnr family transcriptional regulator n=2 Tax=Empedobacter TaxID=59734 RepID=A0ABY8VAZ2_9FLAO|nr:MULTISPECIES: Crp/Fnr family transcriptional regulator [Empedobacter]MCA4775792.1 Crp/Fnr family transcriptional regulator [Empedobacter stercoris]MCA4782252.1 Crp/Fnr family transcriptional regulator [Empedobacter stercoris]MCA4809535.1 Crp/Fnr family transcriptional regulator [Empedobacter stercoris]MDM1524144.1 Crp/Fnr family transcriptional regulator [Empedobacter sp. 225-1]MDM1543216.1 Crp/Fnr family transcriptional regulator [Empedobacter sp. 189-2]
MIKEKIEATYPYQFEDELLDEINELGSLIEFKANDVMIDLNQFIKGMPILLKGAIKIMREDFDEGELLLYFLEKGDTCAMTMACCLGDRQSKIRAIAETDGELVMIPITKMDEWLAKYASWRRFIFDSYNNRMEEMLVAIDNLAFNDMNQRLKKYLLDVASINKGKVIVKTHQEIAYELNTSRVVISRLLKALEKEGFLQLNRNEITIN